MMSDEPMSVRDEQTPSGLEASTMANRRRRVTADLPGIGGVIKSQLEDFCVEEIPLYEPSGDGEHLYLLIEKRDTTTSRVAHMLAREFHVKRSNVGYAGLKDRKAITRQWFSIWDPHREISRERAESLSHEWMTVLEIDRHVNKLRRGHLRGNRFSITVRGVGIEAAPRAMRILQQLAQVGSPNYFGSQRYGMRGNNHLIASAIILENYDAALDRLLGASEPGDEDRADNEARQAHQAKDYWKALNLYPRGAAAECEALKALNEGADARTAIHNINRMQRGFWLSAFQSAIFDEVLVERCEHGTIGQLEIGDIAMKHDNRSLFDVGGEEMTPTLLQRSEAIEISPTGPMWGPAMKRSVDPSLDQYEVTALESAGVTVDRLASYARQTKEKGLGSRRPFRVPLIDPRVEAGADETGSYVRCFFELPRGAFATVAMDEVMKLEQHERKEAR
jgi:tRNA pseudouridine13 synthase